jgi:hypothetical protein
MTMGQTSCPACGEGEPVCDGPTAVLDDGFVAIKTVLCLVFLALAAYIWGSYQHHCLAGSDEIEHGTFWVAALGPIAIIVFVKDLRVSVPLAFAIPIFLLLLRQPYMDWVHGPDSPWPK